MKKMILCLGLCFGLSQVAVAGDDISLDLTEKETKGAIAWIKNNPKKVAAIVASASVIVYSLCKIYNAEADKDAKWAKTTKIKNGLYNGFVTPAKNTWERASKAGKWTTDKAKAGKNAVVENFKAHKKLWIGIPSAVAVIVLAEAIAHYTEMDKVAKDKIVELWNKLFSKKTVIA